MKNIINTVTIFETHLLSRSVDTYHYTVLTCINRLQYRLYNHTMCNRLY